MGEELTIYAKILATLSGQGFTQAEAGLGKTEKAAKGAARGLMDAETAGKQLGRTLQQYLGAAVLGNLVKTSVVEFAKYERSLSAIGKQVETLGGNAGDAVPRIRDFLETLERTSGTARQDLVPSFQKFLGITGSVEGAMYAVGLAADLVEANLGDMGTVGERLSKLFGGRLGEAALGFGVAQRKANGELKTAVEIIQELDAQYSGFGKTQQDAADDLDKINSGWNDFKQTLGKGVAPALQFVAVGMANLTRIIQSVGAGIIVIGNAFGAFIGATAEALPKLFDLKTLFTQGPAAWADGLKTAFLGAIDRFRPELEGGMEELKAIWNRSGQDQGAAMAQGMSDALAVARRKQAEEEATERKKLAAKALEAAKKQAEEEAKAKRDQLIATAEFQQELAEKFQEMAQEEADQEAQNVEERVDNERNAMIGLLDEQIAALEETDARRLELQALRLELEMQQELDAANLTTEAKEAIEKKFQARMKRIKETAAKDDVELERQKADTKRMLWLQLADMSVQLAAAVFGRNKAIAIAETVINTWAAVERVWRYHAENPYLAAALSAVAIAIGVANVRNISKASPGGAGFDDPAHDRIAYMGGKRWAQDMVRNVDLGFREGMAAATERSDLGLGGGGSQSTTNYNQTVNFGHVLGGRAEARRIARILDRARERDQGRRVR